MLRKRQHLVAPKPSRDEDLTLPHLLVVGPTAPAPVNLLDEGGQLLKLQAPLFFQVEKLGAGKGGKEGLVLACPTLQASQLAPYVISVYYSSPGPTVNS